VNIPMLKNQKTIDFDVANYYFNNEKYRYALKWFSRVSENQIPKLELTTITILIKGIPCFPPND